jgi:hypothetical protein
MAPASGHISAREICRTSRLAQLNFCGGAGGEAGRHNQEIARGSNEFQASRTVGVTSAASILNSFKLPRIACLVVADLKS